jgi:hypothetical protein
MRLVGAVTRRFEVQMVLEDQFGARQSERERRLDFSAHQLVNSSDYGGRRNADYYERGHKLPPSRLGKSYGSKRKPTPHRKSGKLIMSLRASVLTIECHLAADLSFLFKLVSELSSDKDNFFQRN